MSVIEIGFPSPANHQQTIETPYVGSDVWNPNLMDPIAYEQSEMPDDKLSAIGVLPGIASGLVLITTNPEAIPPRMVEQINRCLGFLCSEGCIVHTWAAPVLDELGVARTEFPVPTQQTFMQHQKNRWGSLSRRYAADI